MNMPFHKYRPYPVVSMPERQWPSRQITQAPEWCSVDLRDGNQALINPMDLEKKLAMFRLLCEIGFKEIEIGFPSAAQVEFDFARLLVEQGEIPDGVAVQVLTQCREHLVRRTFESLRGVKKSVVHIYNSTSTLQRRVVFKMDRQAIRQIAVDGATLVKKLAQEEHDGQIVFQYSPESFTGTELEFALDVCNAVLDVWQPTVQNKVIINLPATVEMSTPNIYADQIEWFCNRISGRDRVRVSVHPHNDRGTAVAAAELAMMAGADRVEGTLFGNGERTGNVDVLTLAMNLFSQGVDPKLDFSDMQRVISIYERCSEIEVPLRHPYAGELVYTAFSGSHQDAINKGMQAYDESEQDVWEVPYLPIDPSDVGRTYEAVVRINSQSGKGGVAHVMHRDYGFFLPKAMHPEFATLVQRMTEQRGTEVKSAEIYRVFEEEYLNRHQLVDLKHCEIHTVGDEQEDADSRVEVRVKVGNEVVYFECAGNGPIDAFAKGLMQVSNLNYSLMAYHEHALKTGTESEAVAYIQIEGPDHHTYFGVGIDTSISVASLKALVSAINRAFAGETVKVVQSRAA